MIVKIAGLILLGIFTLVGFGVGVNLIGKHYFGQEEPIIPKFTKWLLKQLSKWYRSVLVGRELNDKK